MSNINFDCLDLLLRTIDNLKELAKMTFYFSISTLKTGRF